MEKTWVTWEPMSRRVRSRLPGAGSQLPDLGGQVREVGVLPVEIGEDVQGPVELARGLVGHREVVLQPLVLFLGASGGGQTLLEPLDRELGHPLLEETDPEHAAALEE